MPPDTARLRFSVGSGLYLLDPPLPGEPLFQGDMEVVVDGGPPPRDTVVYLNGAPLVRDTREDDGSRFWHLDPAAAPPTGAADGTVTITVEAGDLAGAITLPCPADVAVTTSAPAGTPLVAGSGLLLSWASSLSVNPVATFASTSLRAFDVGTATALPGVLAHQLVMGTALSASLPVSETSASGYVAELRWHGPFQREGGGDGFCGRVKRLFFRR
jgi:hypothetical protein